MRYRNRTKSVNDLLVESLELQTQLNNIKKPVSIEIEIEEEESDEMSSSDMSKEKIIGAMKIVLTSTFHMYFKAHAIHWNVEGINFPQYHDFFGEKYEELHGITDRIAEYIRILGDKAPATLGSLMANQPADTMTEQDSLDQMIKSFDADNNRMRAILGKAIKVAGHCDEPAIENFLQERLDYHQKLAWMLRVIQK